MIRRACIAIAVLTLAATALVGAISALPAAAVGKTCPSFSSAGLKYFSEVVGSGYSCSTAKTWVVKFSRESVDTTSGSVVLHDGPKGLHCVATQDHKGQVDGGACYKGTLAFPKSGFLWNGS